MKKRHLDGRGKGEATYDYNHDLLLFKIQGRKYKKSVEFQNFVIDIDDKEFIIGLRIFDASKVFQIDKLSLRDVAKWEFNANIENNVINVALKFAVVRRNKIIPIIQKTENFSQQFSQPTPRTMRDSSVECLAVVA